MAKMHNLWSKEEEHAEWAKLSVVRNYVCENGTKNVPPACQGGTNSISYKLKTLFYCFQLRNRA